MQMSPEEIRINYSQAKNKREQIKILAQLNLCDEEKIREILVMTGETLPAKPGPKKTKPEKNRAQEIPEAVREAIAREMCRVQDAIDEGKEKVKTCREEIEQTEKELQTYEEQLKTLAEYIH